MRLANQRTLTSLIVPRTVLDPTLQTVLLKIHIHSQPVGGAFGKSEI